MDSKINKIEDNFGKEKAPRQGKDLGPGRSISSEDIIPDAR
jgi:hypothetical protein